MRGIERGDSFRKTPVIPAKADSFPKMPVIPAKGDSFPKTPVIPAKAGIQVWLENQWIPACAGMTILMIRNNSTVSAH
jgi:hypothetical protein